MTAVIWQIVLQYKKQHTYYAAANFDSNENNELFVYASHLEVTQSDEQKIELLERSHLFAHYAMEQVIRYMRIIKYVGRDLENTLSNM